MCHIIEGEPVHLSAVGRRPVGRNTDKPADFGASSSHHRRSMRILRRRAAMSAPLRSGRTLIAPSVPKSEVRRRSQAPLASKLAVPSPEFASMSFRCHFFMSSVLVHTGIVVIVTLPRHSRRCPYEAKARKINERKRIVPSHGIELEL